MLKYELLTTDGFARRSRMTLSHSVVETPIFMSMGTRGAVKAMPPAELRSIGAQIILGNMFRLWLCPGLEVMNAHEGLRGFNGQDKPVLTDSGDFQTLSLSDLRKIAEEGITSTFPINGDELFLSPKTSVQIQRRPNSDIVIQFDECTPYKVGDRPAVEAEVAVSVHMSLRRTQRSRNESRRGHNPNALFSIVQGGMFENLRDESLASLQAIDADAGGEDFGGYTIGDLSVGEPKEGMMHVLQHVAPRLPTNKSCYLMGTGTPEDLVAGVASDVDMFDCVMPTRDVRNDWLFTRFGDIGIKNATHRNDPRPLDETCDYRIYSNFPRAYLHHLQRVGETPGTRLNTIHNLYYCLELMAEMRTVTESHGFAVFQACFAADRVREAL